MRAAGGRKSEQIHNMVEVDPPQNFSKNPPLVIFGHRADYGPPCTPPLLHFIKKARKDRRRSPVNKEGNLIKIRRRKVDDCDKALVSRTLVLFASTEEATC